jgi:glutaconyl-CoA/methylmalonyl-CoA decarboxylase subunit delta
MQELTLMQKFADPALFDSLSTVDKTTGALVTTLMGMGITFAVLTLLWGCIALLTKILDKTDQRKENKTHELETSKSNPTIVEETINISINSDDDDDELIAVISAALAAASAHENTDNLFIQKIRRVTGNSTAWSHAGGNDSLASRKF